MNSDQIIVLLQAITIVVSIVSLVVSIVNSTKENQKQRMVEITIKHRLSDMDNLKKAYSNLLTYLSPTIIKNSSKTEYVYNLWHSYNETAIYLKINYQQDKEVLNLMKTTCELATVYAETGNNELEDVIIKSSKLLYDHFSLYTYANWVCIKEQAYGTELKSVDYKKIYDKYYNDFIEEI